MKRARIITIGNEILSGKVINTNSSWLAENLMNLGFSVENMVTVSDNYLSIFNSLKDADGSCQIVIVTGGLGPTSDDITKSVVCDFFQSKLIFDAQALEYIETFFSNRNLPMLESNRRQAEIPDNCIPMYNLEGTAPGMWFDYGQTSFVFLPGVPFEMKSIFTRYVIPKLKEINPEDSIIHKTILTHGIGESFLAEKIKFWEKSLPDNISLAYLPSPGLVKLRLTTKSNITQGMEIFDTPVKQLYNIIPQYLFGFDDDTLESVVGAKLENSGQTLAVAESCSGGYLSNLITNIPGSSKYFKGSVVAYSNEIKVKILDVDLSTIETYGAVSEEVVVQMAQNVRKIYNSDFGIAISGIAGPSGGTIDKPVGTVWICVASSTTSIAKKYHFGNHRERNKLRSSFAALHLTIKMINGYLNKTDLY